MSLPRPTLEAKYFVRIQLFDASQKPAQFVNVIDVKSELITLNLGFYFLPRIGKCAFPTAMYQLLTTKQGDRMDYIKALEDKAHILHFSAVPYAENDAVKDAAIFGMVDEKLQEKALADDPTLEALVCMGQTREAVHESVHQLMDNRSQVSRVATKDLSMEEIDSQIQTLMRLKKQGLYSG